MIYRIDIASESDGHAGYAFRESKRAAERYAAALRRAGFEIYKIEALPVPRTKAEILALLSRIAAHAENG
jgi:hypothetical protein